MLRAYRRVALMHPSFRGHTRRIGFHSSLSCLLLRVSGKVSSFPQSQGSFLFSGAGFAREADLHPFVSSNDRVLFWAGLGPPDSDPDAFHNRVKNRPAYSHRSPEPLKRSPRPPSHATSLCAKAEPYHGFLPARFLVLPFFIET